MKRQDRYNYFLTRVFFMRQSLWRVNYTVVHSLALLCCCFEQEAQSYKQSKTSVVFLVGAVKDCECFSRFTLYSLGTESDSYHILRKSRADQWGIIRGSTIAFERRGIGIR